MKKTVGALAFSLATSAMAQSPKPAVVLVHGAFADGSSWSRVIPLLEDRGYYVTAVQMPLTSFADDVAATRRVVAAQKGPVVLVGHSYGGAVITEAAAGSSNVKSLVYVAAFGPDAGETVTEAADKFPAPPLAKALRPDAAGFVYIDRTIFRETFSHDISAKDARIAAATQKPINGANFGAKIDNATWRTIPSWYIVATQDRAINPGAERFTAKRMTATTVEIKASHVPFVSHPAQVARVIEQAAK